MALEHHRNFGQVFVLLGFEVQVEALFFGCDSFAGRIALQEEQIYCAFAMIAGILQEKLFRVDADIQLDNVWVSGRLRRFFFAADDHAQIRGVERAVSGILQGVGDGLFWIGTIGRREVAGAIAQFQPLLGLNLEVAKLAVDRKSTRLNSSVVGVSPVVEGATNGLPNVVVAEKSNATRAISQ